MAENKKLSPFVYWAQTKAEITLRVELRNVKNPKISIETSKLHFNAVGKGAKGEANYGFNLNFHRLIDAENSKFKVTDRQICFNLVKVEPGYWPRLLEDVLKPAWLKIDFDKFQHVEDLEDEVRDVLEDYPEVYKKLLKEELGGISDSLRTTLKTTYLTAYNLWQFVGFLIILTIMAIRYVKDGPDSMEDSMEGTYSAVSWIMKLCFSTQFFEVLHPLVGYTKGSVLEPLIQVGGRGVVFFCLIVAEPRMQTKPVVFYLVLVWCLIEVFRYPYYLLRVFDTEVHLLTWLRYTVWIPLYPLGFILEGVVILRSIPYVEETKRFCVALPNSLNFAFHFPSMLRIYLLFIFLPVMFKMISHMMAQRTKKLAPKKKKKT